jgi:zinc/manganese transport system substrate-binding protein
MSMTRRNAILAVLLGSTLSFSPAAAAEKLSVVASFSILGDIASNIGGDRISLTTLVDAGGDAHAYQPTPADGMAMAEAKVVIVNGMGFEGWMERLVKSSESKAAIIVATEGIKPRTMEEEGKEEGEHAGEHRHDHDGADPHAWQSVANAKIYAANIAKALIAADPDGKAIYEANAAAYAAKLDALETEIKQGIAAIPEERRKIVTGHDAFGYFGDAYGVRFIAPQGVSTEAEVSAKGVARIIRQIKKEGIPAVFIENISDPRLIQRISNETSARVGGTLYSDALSDDKGPATTYIDMMRHNVKELTSALSS